MDASGPTLRLAVLLASQGSAGVLFRPSPPGTNDDNLKFSLEKSIYCLGVTAGIVTGLHSEIPVIPVASRQASTLKNILEGGQREDDRTGIVPLRNANDTC